MVVVRFHFDQGAHPGMDAALKAVIADGEAGHFDATARRDVRRSRPLRD
jgi:hypothetical protein